MTSLPFENIKREILIKTEAESNPNFGCDPFKRKIPDLLDTGIVCLNKPKGPTSHMVADYVKRIFHVEKTGHSGTLDPAVTGVLPVALGSATRVTQALLPAGKEYVCIMHVHNDVPEEKIREAMKEFVGKITQLPPVKSAVVRKEREREVYYLDILEIDGRDVLFKMGCEAGTYVRKVCHDVGEMLGCGAHMAELIRTKVGPFSDKEWVTLQDLEDAYAFWKEENNEKFLRHCVKPMEVAVEHLPKVWIHDSAIDSICHGASLNVPGVVKLHSKIQKNDLVAVMSLKGELVALGSAFINSEQIFSEQKGMCVRINRVFMRPNVYPKRLGVSS